MNTKRKQDLMVFSLAMVSGIVFVYLSHIVGTFMILGSLMISLFKRDFYHFVFESYQAQEKNES